MWTKIVAWWNGLNHVVQAVLILFAGTVVDSVYKQLTVPNACMTWACWGQDISGGLHAGISAVIALYIQSSRGQAKP